MLCMPKKRKGNLRPNRGQSVLIIQARMECHFNSTRASIRFDKRGVLPKDKDQRISARTGRRAQITFQLPSAAFAVSLLSCLPAAHMKYRFKAFCFWFISPSRWITPHSLMSLLPSLSTKLILSLLTPCPCDLHFPHSQSVHSCLFWNIKVVAIDLHNNYK